MEREADDAIFGSARLVKAVMELDIHILVEGSREAIAGAGEHPPAPTSFRRKGDCRVLGRIAQSKYWERFEGPVEDDSARRNSTTGHEGHEERICH